MRRVHHTELEPWFSICRLDIPEGQLGVYWGSVNLQTWSKLKERQPSYSQSGHVVGDRRSRCVPSWCIRYLWQTTDSGTEHSFRSVALRLSGIQSLWNQASPVASSTKPNRFRAWTGHHGNLECQEEERGVQTFAHLPETLVLGFSHLKMEQEFFPPDWWTMELLGRLMWPNSFHSPSIWVRIEHKVYTKQRRKAAGGRRLFSPTTCSFLLLVFSASCHVMSVIIRADRVPLSSSVAASYINACRLSVQAAIMY